MPGRVKHEDTLLHSLTPVQCQAARWGTLPKDGKGGDTSFFAHLKSFFGHFPLFLPLCHWILPIVSPVFEIFETPGMAIASAKVLIFVLALPVALAIARATRN